jgi:hypothetical protein
MPMHLSASARVIALGHLGDVYLYHQLWGYILQMSPDVHALWQAFEGGADAAEVCDRFVKKLTGQPPSELVEIFTQFRCLESAADPIVDDALAAVPVKGRWNVWRRHGDELELWCAWGKRPVSQVRLDAAATAIYDAIDGETSGLVLAQTHGRDAVFALFERLAAIEVQAIKLSPVPLSTYGHERKWPPYLTSTMPYAEVDGTAAATPDLGDYHRESIGDPAEQFDHAETTLAHLFRRSHIALGNKSYGEALIDALIERGVPTGGPLRVLEIGGGTGDLALAASAALRAAGTELSYRIIELSPALAGAQRERGLEVSEGDILEVDIDAGSLDLIIANEMIGDLRPGTRAAAVPYIERHGLDVEGTTDDTLFNTGAFELVERVDRWLAPGGTAVLTEFGELHATPRISTHLDHPEISIRFGHLDAVAKSLGLETDYIYVMDLIDMRRDLEGLATTRSYFRALSALLAEAGAELEKIGYTREMFTDLVAGKVELDDIGDLRFDRIEDRLMGLVPHEFKALILRKPA